MLRSAVTVSVLVLAATLTLTSCSGSESSPTPLTTPKVSLSADPSPSAANNFEDVIAFVQAVYVDDYDTAGGYVADDSPAARYVAHQSAVAQVDSLDGTAQAVDPSDIEVTADEKSNSVKVEDSSGDSPVTYVWQKFEMKNAKIGAWEIKGRPRSLDNRLWSVKSSDKSKGVGAKLVSAYENNRGNVNVVVELKSADRNVRVIDAIYTPAGGYRQKDAANLIPDVDKGGKTLTYFTFNKSRIGGTLKLKVDRIDSGDNSSSYPYTSVTLKVR